MNLRIKTGQVPGDVSKRSKQVMLEHPGDKIPSAPANMQGTREIRLRRAKAFKKMVRMKERAVLKRRAKKEIESTRT
jgi:hypothetical protein